MKMKQQSGFTLIELIMVIVILGILAATALPKFVDLSSDAKQASLSGIAGGLSSANLINYSGCKIKGAVTAGVCAAVAKCSDIGSLMQPSMTILTTVSTTTPYLAPDSASTTSGVTCTLKQDAATATYTATTTP